MRRVSANHNAVFRGEVCTEYEYVITRDEFEARKNKQFTSRRTTKVGPTRKVSTPSRQEKLTWTLFARDVGVALRGLVGQGLAYMSHSDSVSLRRAPRLGEISYRH